MKMQELLNLKLNLWTNQVWNVFINFPIDSPDHDVFVLLSEFVQCTLPHTGNRPMIQVQTVYYD